MIENIESTLGKENSLELGNEHYKQTFSNSCAVACYMMAKSISPDDDFVLDRDTESGLMKRFNNKVTITELIKLALQEDFRVGVFTEVDYRKIFYRESFKEKLRKDFVNFYEKSKYKSAINFNFLTPLDPVILRDLLEDGNAILVNGTIYGIPHLRMISGYQDDKFFVNDPLCDSRKLIEFSELSEISFAPMGQFYFSLKHHESD
jgi:hypothetical protein